MPLDNLSFLQRLTEYGVWGYLWILFISFWGGTVKYLTSLKGRSFNVCEWLSETIISGFVGIVTAMTCQYYQVDFILTSAITGIAAHNGTRSLYLITDFLKKNIGKSFGTTEQEYQSQKPIKLAIRKQKNDSSNRNS